jgi:hypothetical protein
MRNVLLLLLPALVVLPSSVQAAAPAEFISGVTVRTSNGVALRITNPNARNTSFNGNLQRKGATARIASCQSLIEVPVGTARGNHSFGGLCTLDDMNERAQVVICDDDMIGHFKLKKVKHEVPMQELIDFVVTNCFGG